MTKISWAGPWPCYDTTMITYQRAQEIRHAFERQYRTDGPKAIKDFTLLELKETLVHYAGRDEGEGFKVLINQRIAELETKAGRKYDSYIRAWMVIVSLAVALMAYKLREFLF